jgi:hypothetical protein
MLGNPGRTGCRRAAALLLFPGSSCRGRGGLLGGRDARTRVQCRAACRGLGLAALAALGHGDAGACGGLGDDAPGGRRQHLCEDVKEEGEQGREEKLGPATWAAEMRCRG